MALRLHVGIGRDRERAHGITRGRTDGGVATDGCAGRATNAAVRHRGTGHIAADAGAVGFGFERALVDGVDDHLVGAVDRNVVAEGSARDAVIRQAGVGRVERHHAARARESHRLRVLGQRCADAHVAARLLRGRGDGHIVAHHGLVVESDLRDADTGTQPQRADRHGTGRHPEVHLAVRVDAYVAPSHQHRTVTDLRGIARRLHVGERTADTHC